MSFATRNSSGLVASAMLVLACGGKQDDDPLVSSNGGVAARTAGGAAGMTVAGGTAGTLGRGGTSGASVMPEECQIATGAPELSVATPQVVTFKLNNTQTSTRYLMSGADCTTGLAIYSCADGYLSPIAQGAACTLSCDSDSVGCIDCSACMTSYLGVDSGQSTSVSWAGAYYTFEANQVDCECSRAWTAPSGKYRATIPVYSTDVESPDNEPTLVSVDFTYPDLDGVVTLSF